jgi:hypothetical protein
MFWLFFIVSCVGSMFTLSKGDFGSLKNPTFEFEAVMSSNEIQDHSQHGLIRDTDLFSIA